jgi:hypothetical protein
VTRYFYDTEFLDSGRVVDLISIGIVAEDGREYYAISDACTRDYRPWHQRWLNREDSLENRIRRNPWLMKNVVPSLPKLYGDARLHTPWLFDYTAEQVKPRNVIATEVRDFLLADGWPELWADHGAYDHVALCQLWGAMVDLPPGIPMYTNDLMQEARRLGLAWKDLPPQPEGQHNALDDARHNRVKHACLALVAETRRALGTGG